jgi:hypothetical protein
MMNSSASGNRGWSEADGLTIVEMWRNGATQSEIGKHFGVGVSAIAGQVAKLRRRGFHLAARDAVAIRPKASRPARNLSEPVIRPKLLQVAAGNKRWPFIPMVHPRSVPAESFPSEMESIPSTPSGRVRLPSITPERVAARRRLELILDERTLFRTDTVRCVCGKPGAPHCAEHAAVVAKVLG